MKLFRNHINNLNKIAETDLQKEKFFKIPVHNRCKNKSGTKINFINLPDENLFKKQERCC